METIGLDKQTQPKHSLKPESWGVPLDFVPIAEIKTLKEFENRIPLEFFPRKEEIGRILCLAKIMHERRVAKKEIKAEAPITIIDVGGSNGALGKLVTDLAKENNLLIEYTVVDPDFITLGEAEKYYADNKALSFFAEDAAEFTCDINGGMPQIPKLIQEKKATIDVCRNRIMEVKRMYDEMSQVIESHVLSENELREFITRVYAGWKYFFVQPISLEGEISEYIRCATDEEKYHWVKRFMFFSLRTEKLDARIRIDGFNQQIRSLQSMKSTNADLVINSWMPPGMDFTQDIQHINGAAILYFLDRTGATGKINPVNKYGETSSLIEGSEGQDDVDNHQSYRQNGIYRNQLAWLSHAVTEPKFAFAGLRGEELEQANLFRRRGNHDKTLINTALFQVCYRYLDGSPLPIDPSPSVNDIEIQGQYPWEKDLNKIHGVLTDIIPIDWADPLEKHLDKFNQVVSVIQEKEDEETYK